MGGQHHTASFSNVDQRTTLRTAQRGSTQRTRSSKLESTTATNNNNINNNNNNGANYNVWEAPLSQKFDFTKKPDALLSQHSRYE